MSVAGSRKVFISYSHYDEDMRDELATHLRALQLAGQLIEWDDRQIAAGADWPVELQVAIDSAAVAVLLVSSHFLASDFIQKQEVPRLLERRSQGLVIVPVIVRPCPWRRIAWLSSIQAFPPREKAITSGSPFQVEEDFATVAVTVADLLGRSVPQSLQHPGLSSAPGRPHRDTLPAATDEFIGRERERREAERYLVSLRKRVLTLLGPPGTGKTRLAVQVARDVRHQFADDAYFIDLLSVGNPELVAATIARALGVDAGAVEDVLPMLSAFLNDKEVLLVLDGFEQVMGARAAGTEVTTQASGPHQVSALRQLNELLRHAPRLQVLVTSRQPMRLPGEQRYVVEPLELPPADLPVASGYADVVRHFDAVRLFETRAQSVLPQFTVSQTNAQTIVEICRRLDGLPLAIELAAGRIHGLPPSRMLDRVSSTPALLKIGSGDDEDRHARLWGAIDWSYGLLDTTDRRLFRRISVCVGGCSLEAAGAICGTVLDDSDDLEDRLARLAEKSFVRRESSEELRYSMLRVLRAFAEAQTDTANQVDEARKSHAAFFLEMAETAFADMSGAQQGVRLHQIEIEHDNLVTALNWFIDRGLAGEAMRVAATLGHFWWSHGDYAEGQRQLTKVLDLGGNSNRDRARVLEVSGLLGVRLGALESASRLFDECQAIGRQTSDDGVTAAGLAGAALVALERADFVRARRFLQESLELYRLVPDHRGTGEALDGLGVLETAEGRYAEGRELLERSLTEYLSVGDELRAAWVLNDLARVALAEGKLTEVDDRATAALRIGRRIGDRQLVAWAFIYLGLMQTATGQYAAARACFDESLDFASLVSDMRTLALCLEGTAGLAMGEGKPERALELAGAAKAIRDRWGIPITQAESTILEHRLEGARTALGAEASSRAYSRGLAMDIEQAATAARDL